MFFVGCTVYRAWIIVGIKNNYTIGQAVKNQSDLHEDN
jgi:hypothetical protein